MTFLDKFMGTLGSIAALSFVGLFISSLAMLVIGSIQGDRDEQIVLSIITGHFILSGIIATAWHWFDRRTK